MRVLTGLVLLIVIVLAGCILREPSFDPEAIEKEMLNEDRPLPVVAIHVSERSRNQWSRKDALYFEQYTALEEILNSHKIPFIELTDKDIESRLNLQSGTPRFPILFTLNNEVWSPEGIDAVNTYVASGGVTFFTHATFTRLAGNDAAEGCFLLDVGLDCVNPVRKENLLRTDLMSKREEHPLVAHLPDGDLVWRMSRYFTTPYDSFRVRTTTGREILRAGNGTDETVSLAVQDRGNGTFIYDSQFNMLWGRYQGEPGTQGALIALNAVRWAFLRARIPLISLKPWGSYDAAFMLRFDVETSENNLFALFPEFVDAVVDNNETATFYVLVDQEKKGKPDPSIDYYSIEDPAVQGLLRDAESEGVTIGSHSTWHIGPDFDRVERRINIWHSLFRLEDVLGHPVTDWVAPAFGANNDYSLRLMRDLGIRMTGNQNIGDLPHRSLSPEVRGLHYPVLEVPTSTLYHPDALNGSSLATVLEHHSLGSIEALVNESYERGGMINLYAHLKPENLEKLAFLIKTVRAKPNVWHPAPDELLDYWARRDAVDYDGLLIKGDYAHVFVMNNGNSTADGVLRVETLGKTFDIPFSLAPRQRSLLSAKIK
ncbi:hypothetical protein HY493_00785 [Candidatus Woesearchaeota archaeon]|nr:hypothetical protein [Candidatus Woesearchaeota archaeon]